MSERDQALNEAHIRWRGEQVQGYQPSTRHAFFADAAWQADQDDTVQAHSFNALVDGLKAEQARTAELLAALKDIDDSIAHLYQNGGQDYVAEMIQSKARVALALA